MSMRGWKEAGKQALAYTGIRRWRRFARMALIAFATHSPEKETSGSIRVYRPLTPDDPLEIRLTHYTETPNTLTKKTLQITIPPNGEPTITGDYTLPETLIDYIYTKDPITQLLDITQDLLPSGEHFSIGSVEIPANPVTLEGFAPFFEGAITGDAKQLLAFEPLMGSVEGPFYEDPYIIFDHNSGFLQVDLAGNLRVGSYEVDYLELHARFYHNSPRSSLRLARQAVREWKSLPKPPKHISTIRTIETRQEFKWQSI